MRGQQTLERGAHARPRGLARWLATARWFLSRLRFDAPTRRFIRHNRRKWRGWSRRGSRDVVLVELLDWSPSIYYYSYVLNVLARQKKAAIEAFSFYDPPPGPFRSFRRASRRLQSLYTSFGARLTLSPREAHRHRTRARRMAQELLGTVRTKDDLERLEVNGVLLGDLVYDTYLRARNCTGDLADPALHSLLEQVLSFFFAAEEYFARKRVCALFTTHGVYIWVGVVVRLAAKLGVPCYRVRKGFVIERADAEAPQLRSAYCRHRQAFAEFGAEQKRKGVAAGRQLIEERLSGVIQPRIMADKSAYAAHSTERILRPTSKPKILVLPSCFFDAVHLYRWMLFPDFYEWLVFTLERASETDFEWYVKPHPASLPENDAVFARLRQQFPKITFLDRRISNRQLVTEGIKAAFTVHGTAAHELAYLGIPVVNSGDNYHITYDFNLHPRTIEEYESLIRRADRLAVEIDRDRIAEFVYMQYIHYDQPNPVGVQLIDPGFYRFETETDPLDEQQRTTSRYNQSWSLDYFLDHEMPERQADVLAYVESCFADASPEEPTNEHVASAAAS